MDIPRPVEDRHALGFVAAGHLFGADGKRDIAKAGLEMRIGEMKRRARAGAGVFDIRDRDFGKSHVAQRDLAADHVLPFHRRLGRIGEEGGADIVPGCPGIGERTVHRFPREVLDRSIEEFSEGRHADANHIDVVHFALL